MPRLDKSTALDILARCKVPLGVDFHALASSQVDSIVAEADLFKYRAPRHANGSRARYFHAYLTRAARHEIYAD